MPTKPNTLEHRRHGYRAMRFVARRTYTPLPQTIPTHHTPKNHCTSGYSLLGTVNAPILPSRPLTWSQLDRACRACCLNWYVQCHYKNYGMVNDIIKTGMFNVIIKTLIGHRSLVLLSAGVSFGMFRTECLVLVRLLYLQLETVSCFKLGLAVGMLFFWRHNHIVPEVELTLQHCKIRASWEKSGNFLAPVDQKDWLCTCVTVLYATWPYALMNGIK